MSLNDILTLVISGFALVFSLVSFVYTVLMGPRLKVLIGEEILLSNAPLFKSCFELVDKLYIFQ